MANRYLDMSSADQAEFSEVVGDVFLANRSERGGRGVAECVADELGLRGWEVYPPSEVRKLYGALQSGRKVGDETSTTVKMPRVKRMKER